MRPDPVSTLRDITETKYHDLKWFGLKLVQDGPQWWTSVMRVNKREIDI
jgi:hypothetical protein